LYRQSQAAYASDREFISHIESTLPKGAMVFQMPYLRFPEAGTCADYELFRPYLHSRDLRWSFGAFKGRPGAKRIEEIAATQTDAKRFAQSVARAGYAGILVDRASSQVADLIAQLQSVLEIAPEISPNGRLLFFRLDHQDGRPVGR
jgi:phosphoglycerol transferase